MAVKPLCLDSLGDLADGSARLIIDRAIQEAVSDTDDRAADDGKPRKVTIELTLERRGDGLIEAHVAAQAKLPPRRTASTVGRPIRRDEKTRVFFQEWNAENPDQGTFPVLDKDGGEVES